MAKQNVGFVTFNRGMVDNKILSRNDLERVNQGAEIQTNYMPSILGSMTLRAGTNYKTSTKDNLYAVNVPFVFSTNDNSALEFTHNSLRILTDGVPLSRQSVTTTINNGEFTTNITGWTDADESGSASSWSSLFEGSALLVGGENGNRAILRQQITVAGDNINKQHAFRFTINGGIVTVRIGTVAGENDYFLGNNLNIGTHSIAFTPTGSFYIQIESDKRYHSFVSSVSIESGVLTLPTIYAESDLKQIRHTQSGDVIFLACGGYRPLKISRRSFGTWSIEDYQQQDGPFTTRNLSDTKVSISTITAETVLTATTPIFESGHIGSLFRLFPSGQNISTTLSDGDEFSDYIIVEGVGGSRGFTILISGTWVGTLTLQRSFDDGISWEDVAGKTWTANTSEGYTDDLNNTTIWYRIGFKPTAHTSGTANIGFLYSRGGREGILLISGFTNATSVNAKILKSPASLNSTDDWSFGEWSSVNGYPQAVALHEGRLWFTRGGTFYASVSDAYESFDDTIEGDSKSFSKTTGGTVESAYWLLPVQRLIIGTAGGQRELRSSSFDEPLTATASTPKILDSISASNINPVAVDINGIYISGKRLYELSYSSDSFGYVSKDLTVLTPEIAGGRFVNLAVSRKPETKLHCVRSDGKVAILCYDNSENLRAWVLWETDGFVENIYVLPNTDTEQDDIYYVVRRFINGVTKRYHELWSMESECIGGAINKNLDCHISASNTQIITGLTHLEGETVYVWADGLDLGAFIVASGQISLDKIYQNIVVGLGYTALYKSTKLSYAASLGTPLTQMKIITQIGFNCHSTHIKGFSFGRDLDNLNDLPMSYNYEAMNENTIFDTYDAVMSAFGGSHDTDARLHIAGNANRPHTISAVVLGIQTNDKG